MATKLRYVGLRTQRFHRGGRRRGDTGTHSGFYRVPLASPVRMDAEVLCEGAPKEGCWLCSASRRCADASHSMAVRRKMVMWP